MILMCMEKKVAAGNTTENYTEPRKLNSTSNVTQPIHSNCAESVQSDGSQKYCMYTE